MLCFESFFIVLVILDTLPSLDYAYEQYDE